MIEIISVGLGGFVGAVLRYLVGLIPISEHGFPVKTLIINILGCFAIGVISAAGAKLSPNMTLFLKTGICGGFTTFSTFALETSGLINHQSTFSAVVYMTLSLILGVLAVAVAQNIVK